MKKILSLFLVGTLFLIFGCGKDDKGDNNPAGPSGNSDAPTFKIHQVQVPAKMQQSSDEHAQTVVFYMGLANAFGATLNNNFVPPALNKTNGDGPWDQSWSKDNLNIKVHIEKLTDKYTWEVLYNGNDGKYDYVNFVAFRAEQGLDDHSGKFFAYVPNTNIILGQYTWSLDETGKLNFEVIAETFMPGSRFIGSSNADLSGYLQILRTVGAQQLLQEKYQWNKDGNGEWWLYDESGGLLGNGTWN